MRLARKSLTFLPIPRNFHRKKDTKESLLSHQIFRNQISEHHLRKIRQSRLLNRSIFGLVLSDDKLTVSPIYACIQMEVAFVSLLYANISTTFAINIKLLSLSSNPMIRDEHLSLTLWN